MAEFKKVPFKFFSSISILKHHTTNFPIVFLYSKQIVVSDF